VTPRAEQISSARKGFKYPPAIIVSFLRWFALVTSKLFWSISFQGLENIPVGTRGFVVASNHQTYFDPAWIAIKLKRRLRFMAWDQAFNWSFIGPMIRFLGAFPVRQNSGPSKSTIVESLRSLRDGAALVIFPEGGRAFDDGQLHEFKPGAAHIALHAKVPILPVTIRGGNKIWPQGQRYPHFFRRVEVTFHKDINVETDLSGDERDQYLSSLNDELMKIIGGAL
jgi:1-acyl-sn-glycerol-3-phosphate acyltransferase